MNATCALRIAALLFATALWPAVARANSNAEEIARIRARLTAIEQEDAALAEQAARLDAALQDASTDVEVAEGFRAELEKRTAELRAHEDAWIAAADAAPSVLRLPLLVRASERARWWSSLSTRVGLRIDRWRAGRRIDDALAGQDVVVTVNVAGAPQAFARRFGNLERMQLIVDREFCVPTLRVRLHRLKFEQRSCAERRAALARERAALQQRLVELRAAIDTERETPTPSPSPAPSPADPAYSVVRIEAASPPSGPPGQELVLLKFYVRFTDRNRGGYLVRCVDVQREPRDLQPETHHERHDAYVPLLDGSWECDSGPYFLKVAQDRDDYAGSFRAIYEGKDAAGNPLRIPVAWSTRGRPQMLPAPGLVRLISQNQAELDHVARRVCIQVCIDRVLPPGDYCAAVVTRTGARFHLWWRQAREAKPVPRGCLSLPPGPFELTISLVDHPEVGTLAVRGTAVSPRALPAGDHYSKKVKEYDEMLAHPPMGVGPASLYAWRADARARVAMDLERLDDPEGALAMAQAALEDLQRSGLNMDDSGYRYTFGLAMEALRQAAFDRADRPGAERAGFALADAFFQWRGGEERSRGTYALELTLRDLLDLGAAPSELKGAFQRLLDACPSVQERQSLLQRWENSPLP